MSPLLKAIAYQNIYTRVSQKVRLTRSHVRRVAIGERQSAPVMDALLAVISEIESRFGGSDALRTSPTTTGHDTPNGTGPVDPSSDLDLRRAELRAMMDALDLQMDTRPPDSACPICGCTADNRCAIPEGRFGFTRCGWNVELGACSSPTCTDHAKKAANDRPVVIACHGEAQAVKRWLDAGGLELVEAALRKRQQDRLSRALHEATEAHRWRPID